MENIIIQSVLVIWAISVIIISFLLILLWLIVIFYLLNFLTRKIRIYWVIIFKYKNMTHRETILANDLWDSFYKWNKHKVDKYFDKK